MCNNACAAVQAGHMVGADMHSGHAVCDGEQYHA